MHWALGNINPLLAVRGRLCSGQWTQIWPGIWQEWRAQVSQQRAERREQRRARRADRHTQIAAPAEEPAPRKKRAPIMIDGHPTTDHPWRDPRPFPKTWAHSPTT